MAPLLLKDVEALKRFRFERILNEDPFAHSLSLLGSFPNQEDEDAAQPAIIRVEKTVLPASFAPTLITQFVRDVQLMENTSIYTWLLGWLGSSRESPDVKINIVYPATETHIRKYSTQDISMIHETPELYERIVKPFIISFPPSRTEWVDDILSGKSEADKVLFKDPSPEEGYILLPDMKWDLVTVSSLYLMAIALSRNIRSLRDLRKNHLPMLRSIRAEATRMVKERWGLGEGSIRLFVHYQPSYCEFTEYADTMAIETFTDHFHVHIMNANYYGLMGSTVGQAHLLDDIISLLELDPDNGASIFERLTLTYGLGDQHGLYEPLKNAQSSLE